MNGLFEIKNHHEKLTECIQHMLIDLKYSLPYYGNFNLFVNFHEVKDASRINTCAVNVTSKGFNFYYNPQFLEKLSQKEVNFIVIHEDFHLLFNHPKRTLGGNYDPRLSNIAQDMIINHIIWEDISHDFVEIPKDENGKNMALFVPKDYEGNLVFEELYEWLREEMDKIKKEQKSCSTCGGSGKVEKDQNQQGQGQQGQNQQGQNQQGQNQQGQNQQGQGQQGQGQQGQGQGDGQDQQQDGNDGNGGQGKGQGQQDQKQDQQDGNGDGGNNECNCPDCNGSGKKPSNKPSYGAYGKNPSKDGGTIDTWSLDQILQDMENNNGQYMDVHLNDEVPDELRESMVQDAMHKLQSRGLAAGNMEGTLNKLRKKRKDYLREIKRTIGSFIFGSIKNKTITRPNRRQIDGLKGNRKTKPTISLGLDTSGSMGGQGTFERVLSYVYKQDVAINFMEADTQVNWVEKMKSSKKLASIPIKGLGGTALQPMIDYHSENFNDTNLVILTDGYTDSLDFSRTRGRVLIISVGVPCPITVTNGKVKQICVEDKD